MDNKTKKIVTKEWLRAFPSLRPYAQNKLYKVIGAFICGIELIKLPHIDSYRPHFVIYPIYKKDNKSCLDYPVLMFEFYNSKKLQLNQIKQSSKGWNMDMFETWYGKFDLWFSNLEATICNREEFLKQIETNKQDKKIAKLQSSELIL